MIGDLEALLPWLDELKRPLSISVLTSCTNEKRMSPCQAEDLYMGQQHVRLMRGVRAFRALKSGDIDLKIVSAKYGLISGSEKISPYDVTFSGMPNLRRRGRILGLPNHIKAWLAEPVDLKIVILGLAYLEACDFDWSTKLVAPTVVMCGSHYAEAMPDVPGLVAVALTNREARKYSCGLIALKGELTRRLLYRAVQGVKDEHVDERLGTPADHHP